MLILLNGRDATLLRGQEQLLQARGARQRRQFCRWLTSSERSKGRASTAISRRRLAISGFSAVRVLLPGVDTCRASAAACDRASSRSAASTGNQCPSCSGRSCSMNLSTKIWVSLIAMSAGMSARFGDDCEAVCGGVSPRADDMAPTGGATSNIAPRHTAPYLHVKPDAMKLAAPGSGRVATITVSERERLYCAVAVKADVNRRRTLLIQPRSSGCAGSRLPRIGPARAGREVC
jgi:hypothetical protein